VNAERVLGKVGKFKVCFRDDQLTSHVGMVLGHEVARLLGVEQIVAEELHVKPRERGSPEGQAVGGLLYTLLLGGDCLSDREVRRGDPGTQELLAQEAVLAPRTAREFLQKVDLGDIRDLPRVNLRVPQRVRTPQTSTTCTIALDSSLSEHASTRKQASTKASNGQIGSQPLCALWAAEGEWLFSPLRRGRAHTSRTVVGFVAERFKRVPAPAAVALRADRSFSRKEVGQWCEAHPLRFRLPAAQTAPLLAVLEALSDHAWPNLPADYPWSAVAECRSHPARWAKPYRYVVKRQWTERKKQALCWHSPVFVTKDEAPAALELEVWHLQHADMGNRIKAHKSALGWEKWPTGSFPAHWVSLLSGQLAFHWGAWCKQLVLPASSQRATLKTLRHHVGHVAGKSVPSARQCFWGLSDPYRYQSVWQFALDRLAHLQFN
jgi:hypothetical protein